MSIYNTIASVVGGGGGETESGEINITSSIGVSSLPEVQFSNTHTTIPSLIIAGSETLVTPTSSYKNLFQFWLLCRLAGFDIHPVNADYWDPSSYSNKGLYQYTRWAVYSSPNTGQSIRFDNENDAGMDAFVSNTGFHIAAYVNISVMGNSTIKWTAIW